jgi:hypothetical protein
VTGAAGVAGLAVGGALGGLARSRWSTALAGCLGGDRTRCSAPAIADGHTASTLATGSTIAFVAGGAALAAGVVVALTAPRRPPASAAWVIVPAFGPGLAGGIVRGRF